MRYVRDKGCTLFDLAGVAPEPANQKEAGIRRFKEKWGGKYVEYSRFEKRTALGNAWHKVKGSIQWSRRSLKLTR